MKNILLLVCILLTSVDVIAETYYMIPHWIVPTERENCIEQGPDGKCAKYTPLAPDEIKYFTSFNADCETGAVIGEPRTTKIMPHVVKQFIKSDVPKLCLKYTTTDTDGRESRYSDLFILNDYRTPKSVECKP